MKARGIGIAAALPLAGALFVVGPGLVADRTPLLRDLLLFFQPWTDYLVRRVRAGELPLWNPLVYCGTSVAGQIHGRLYYPAFPLYLALPYREAVLIDLALHIGLAGLFAALFLRRLGVGPAGAAFGAIVSSMNGWILAKMEAPLKVGLFTFLPLALLAFVDAYDGRPRRAAATLALAVALQIASGYPPIAGYAIPLECLMGIALLAGRLGTPGAGAFTRTAAIAGGAALGVMLSGIVLLPFLDQASRTDYWQPFTKSVAFARSLPPAHLLGAALPRVAGLPGIDRYWGGELEDFGAGAMYVGAAALVFAAAAILASVPRRAGDAGAGAVADDRAPLRRRAVWALAAAALVALLIAFGRHAPLFGLLRDHVPIYAKTRWPTHSLGVVPAAIGLLAGIGVDVCARWVGAGDTRRRRRRAALAIALGALAAAALAAAALRPAVRALLAPAERALFPHQTATFRALGETYMRGDLVRLALTAGASALVVALPARAWTLLALVAAIDLALLGRTLVPFAPGNLFAERPGLGALAPLARSSDRALRLGGDEATVNALSGARHPAVFREARRALVGTTPLLLDLPLADGADALRPRRNSYLVNALEQPGTRDDIRERVAAMLGVERFLLPSALTPDRFATLATVADTIAFRTPSTLGVAAMPFAYVVARATALAADDAQLARLGDPAFDPSREAIVAERPPGYALDAGGTASTPAGASGADAAPAPRDPLGSCVALRPSPERIEVTARAATDALLVVRESHDPGWRAFVDGAETPIVRVNFLFMGIPLHAGDHRVVLRFAPRAYRVGAALTALGALALATLAWPARRRRSPSRAPSHRPSP